MKIQKILLIAALIVVGFSSAQQIKTKVNGKETHYIAPMAVTPQNIEFALREKKAGFVVRAFHNGIDTKEFEEKYGLRIIITNCVGAYFGNDDLNNKTLSNYLTKKFGDVWKKEIPITPVGL